MVLLALTPMMPARTEVPGERSQSRGVVVEHKEVIDVGSERVRVIDLD
jgi:hypothetical protein